MGQKTPILDKIKRNLDQMDIDATRDTDSVTLTSSNRTISYVPADIQKPMGGVDPDTNPFLGIGVGNPGKLKIKGASGENSVADIIGDAETARVLTMLGGFANDKLVEEGDSTTELVRIEGHVDFVGMGQ